LLDGVAGDYIAARSSNKQEAPILLAALVEAFEQACLEFQSLQSGGACGFQDFGIRYFQQGRLPETRAILEDAVEISLRDFA
jgi:hypothetical protein